MPEVTLKKGDTTPEFQATLEDAAQEFDGDETVRFYMEGPSDPNGPAGDLLVNSVIPEDNIRYEDPENPEVTYDFAAGQTSQNGTCRAEVVVIYGDGEVQSFPEGQFYTIDVNETLRREVPPEQPLTDVHVDVETVDADTVSAPALEKVESLVGPATGGKTLSDFEGENLAIDGEGSLNATDTNTQLSEEQVRTAVAAFLTASGATSIAYDDANDVLTISSTDENTQLSADQVRTMVSAYLVGGTNIELVPDTEAGTLTIDADHDHAGDQLGTEAEPVSTEYVESSHVGELSVGTGGTVSTIPLQDEDHEVIDSTVYSGTSESTTSTTYENAFTSVAEMGLLAGGIASSLDYSNYYLQLVSTLHIDDANETVYHKLKDGPSGDPNAEISHTGDTGYPIVVSDLIPYNPYQNGYARISTEMKVSGGSGTVYVTKLALIGEI